MSLRVECDLSGVDALRASAAAFREAVPRILDEAADLARRVMYDYAPKRTGRLAESILVQAPHESERLVGPTVEYASYVEYGRGWVYPVRAKALRIELESGEVIFRKSARPAAGKHFVEKTMYEVRDALPQIAEKIVEEVVKED
ncbi:MAG: HK97 gp10 family phage protein [Candidatus Aenigmatarchaeota archaeon]